mgnify:CR=1 FL=1
MVTKNRADRTTLSSVALMPMGRRTSYSSSRARNKVRSPAEAESKMVNTLAHSRAGERTPAT